MASLPHLFGFKAVTKVTAADQPDSKTLRKHVEELARLNRTFDHGDLDKAADYVRDEWRKLGLAVREQTYTVSGKGPYDIPGRTYRNLMVSLGPPDADRIILGAHYDVCTDAVPSVTHMPGADDNASGVAGLLELSRLLMAHSGKLNKRIDLVAFTLEEPPYFRTSEMGSAHHARQAFEEAAQSNRKILGMIALEMIGYFREERNSQQYPLPALKRVYGDQGNFIGVVGDFASWPWLQQVQHTMRRNMGLAVKWMSVSPQWVPGIDFSDHLNYAKLGIPAVMVTDTAFNRNPNYHQPTDTPDTLDYEKMAQVVQGVLGSVLNVS
jgi:hypothetical protein